jgi:hypothetical protein
MRKVGFGEALLRVGSNADHIATAHQVFQRPRSGSPIPVQLQKEIRNKELEAWLYQEAGRRLADLPPGLTSFKARQDHLEIMNRFPDGSMTPISLDRLRSMNDFYGSVHDILDRARNGKELLKSNRENEIFGTAARGLPLGGASSRAQKWLTQNSAVAQSFGLAATTPRFLYRVGGRTLAQLTVDNSQVIARELGRVFPNIIMTNSEIVEQLMQVVREEWGNFRRAELENTIFFNQIVLPRLWVDDQQPVAGQLFPAGHGDYPYLMSVYQMAKTLRSAGIKYFVFSNGDEWLFQADPVMISIADELFKQGHHMVIIGVGNTNNQFGGGFVVTSDGQQSLVETPRLPWEIVKEGKAPLALNTTFYLIDVDYLAEHEAALQKVDKSLIVKEIPGRQGDTTEQIFGVDSWAGNVFAQVLNPAFIRWPRMNFLGIKDAGFISDRKDQDERGGRSAFGYVNETVAVWPHVMRALLTGESWAAEYLFNSKYSYLPPTKP